MAGSEQKGGVPSPDFFGGIMKNAGFPDMEVSGFRGKMADRITQWNARGLGRAIGFPLFTKEGKEVPGEFRGIMFALPLTDHTKTGHDQRVLLLAPAEEACRYVVVSPRQTEAPDETSRGIENAEHLRAFGNI